MQQAIPGSLALPASSSHATIDETQRARFGDVLHSAFAVLARYPIQILTFSFLCFAGAAIIGAVLYSALMLNGLFTRGSFFTLATNAYHLQLQAQAALGTFTFLVGRGAITWIALHAGASSGAPAGDTAVHVSISIRAALVATLSRWKPLLISSAFYGLLISISLIGIVWVLREMRMDTSNYRWIRRDANSVLNMTLVRSIGLLPPDPGSPFTELYAAIRYNLSRQSISYFGLSMYQTGPRMPTAIYLLAGVAGLLLAFATETVLCMRTASIMHSSDRHALRWLRHVLRLSLSHFWRVAAWRWSVRLIIVALYAACLTLPLALHQSLVIPAMVNEVRAYWPYPINATSHSIGIALVSMVLVAFGLIFEARMYLALAHRQAQAAPENRGVRAMHT